MLPGVGDALFPRMERPERVFPRRDDLERRVERHHGQLEPHLIVAFAGGAVRHGIGVFLVRDFHRPFGDERPGEAGSEKIANLRTPRRP